MQNCAYRLERRNQRVQAEALCQRREWLAGAPLFWRQPPDLSSSHHLHSPVGPIKRVTGIPLTESRKCVCAT